MNRLAMIAVLLTAGLSGCIDSAGPQRNRMKKMGFADTAEFKE